MVNKQKALILHSKVARHLTDERIKKATKFRAHELYVRGGRKPGKELHYWLEAEKQILKETGFEFHSGL